MSITSVPFFRPAATPLSPNSTASTCGVSGTMAMTTSLAAATSFGVLASFRPFFFSSSGAGVLCTQLVTSWPPSSRWPAMGAPMMPRPMNPIFAMTFRSFRLSLCGLFRRGAGGEVGAQPAEAPGGAGLGLVLAADPALVAHAVEGVEQEGVVDLAAARLVARSEEHTSELQSLMRTSYAVF